MDTTEDLQLKQLVNSGLAFIREITERYGVAEGTQIWENIMTHVDDEVKGAIMFAMLTGQSYKVITLTSVPSSELINAIRAVRNATGMGLKEAKDTVEGVMGRYGPKINARLEIENDQHRAGLQNELRAMGATFS